MFLVALLFGASFCFGDYLCYNATKTVDTLQISVITNVNGWVGFGVCNSTTGMATSDILLFWKVNNTFVYSQRGASKYGRPDYLGNVGWTVSSAFTENRYSKVVFSRSLGRNGTFMNDVGTTFITAYTNTSITNSSAAYSISKHLNRSHWSADFSGKVAVETQLAPSSNSYIVSATFVWVIMAMM